MDVSCSGEIHEYKEDLASLDKSKKKDAVKKVIAAMTVGKDVSMLFPHVVNCMQTDDLELKKLVYLYLINYAKTQPDLAIMGVNTFVKVSQQNKASQCMLVRCKQAGVSVAGKARTALVLCVKRGNDTSALLLQDTQDPNPLIRALAVRTMGCIRVDKITEYLCDPLQRCLKVCEPSHSDMQLAVPCSNCPNQSLQRQSTSGITVTPCVIQDDDPYVRKTAAVCVAKLHDINAELVEDRGFLDTLKVSI